MESVNLSPNQVLFILRSVGTVNLYNTSGKGKYGREDFMVSFLQDWQTSIGQLAAQMALKYGLDYNFNQKPEGVIVLQNPPSVDDIRLNVEGIGMWIPYIFRNSPELALTYFERYGNLYSKFKQARKPEVDQLLWSPPKDLHLVTLINLPSYKDNDFYIQRFLELFLRDLYTDFDMFDQFSTILLPVVKDIQNRPQMIQTIIQAQEPAGHFDIAFTGFQNPGIQIEHTYNGQKQTYFNDQIKQMARNGKLWFKNQTLPHIGLYQIAIRLKPEYVNKIHGINPPASYIKTMATLYPHFLNQIKIAEKQGQPKIRFSETFADFNADLNQGDQEKSGLIDLSRLTI